MFLKREIKTLLKCTETELNTMIRVCVYKKREREREKGWKGGERMGGREKGRITNSTIFCHHGCYQISVPIKVLLHFQCTTISET